MSPEARSVLTQLQALPADEQAEVIAQAEHSNPHGFTPAQQAELDRRHARLIAGDTKFYTLEESIDHARKRYAERRPAK